MYFGICVKRFVWVSRKHPSDIVDWMCQALQTKTVHVPKRYVWYKSRLSSTRKKWKWTRRDSNSRPLQCQCNDLPADLLALYPREWLSLIKLCFGRFSCPPNGHTWDTQSELGITLLSEIRLQCGLVPLPFSSYRSWVFPADACETKVPLVYTNSLHHTFHRNVR